MKRKVCVVGIYSLVHALVDFACATLLTLWVTTQYGARPGILLISFIAYNFFAFAMQLPIGILADILDCNALVSAAGCLTVALAYALSPLGVLAAVVAGIGNAMFHIGGGIDVLNISDHKATLPGIFVATGAMGLFLGSNAARFHVSGISISFLDSDGKVLSAAVILMLILAAAALVWLYKKAKGEFGIRNAEVIFRRMAKPEVYIAWCMLITILIRGCIGLVMNYEWKNSFTAGLITVSAVVLGKMLGGIAGDRFGWRRVTVGSLLVAAVLFVFSFDSMVCGVAAILLFNMSMPITLTALANRFEANKGMAFGMTTVALFIGALPALLGVGAALFSLPVLVGTTLLSAGLLWYGLKNETV